MITRAKISAVRANPFVVVEQFTTLNQFWCHCLRIGGAALIRGWCLLTFLSQMPCLFESGAYSSKYGMPMKVRKSLAYVAWRRLSGSRDNERAKAARSQGWERQLSTPNHLLLEILEEFFPLSTFHTHCVGICDITRSLTATFPVSACHSSAFFEGTRCDPRGFFEHQAIFYSGHIFYPRGNEDNWCQLTYRSGVSPIKIVLFAASLRVLALKLLKPPIYAG